MMDITSRPGKKSTRLETAKTVALTALVVAIIAFVGGMNYSNSQHSNVERAVSNAVQAQAQPSK